MSNWEIVSKEEKNGVVATLSKRILSGDIQFSLSIGQKLDDDRVGRFIQFKAGIHEAIQELVSAMEEKAHDMELDFTSAATTIEPKPDVRHNGNGKPDVRRNGNGKPTKRGRPIGLSALAEQDAKVGGHDFTPKRERKKAKGKKPRKKP